MTPAEFARQANRTAQAVRSLPRALRTNLDTRTAPQVAQPLAARVRAAGRGVYGTRVATTTTVTTTGRTPVVTIGGTRRIASQGATGRDLVWGTEFGGGRTPRTRQFIRNRSPFIRAAIDAGTAQAGDNLAGIVEDTIDQAGVTRG